MEQRRVSGKSHWYHETQSSARQAQALPLVPEAATVDDPFLLNLTLPDALIQACNSWLTPAARNGQSPAHIQRLRPPEYCTDCRSGIWRAAPV